MRSMISATCGKCSTTSKPGTDEGIGFIVPRISSGASGFMSNVSSWLGDPYKKEQDAVLGSAEAAAAMSRGWAR